MSTLYIDEWNTIHEFDDGQVGGEYWDSTHVQIIPSDMDKTFACYLELANRRPYKPKDLFTTVEELIKRVEEYYFRKERNIHHFQDIRLGDSRLTSEDRYNKILLKKPRPKKKNEGEQLSLF